MENFVKLSLVKLQSFFTVNRWRTMSTVEDSELADDSKKSIGKIGKSNDNRQSGNNRSKSIDNSQKSNDNRQRNEFLLTIAILLALLLASIFILKCVELYQSKNIHVLYSIDEGPTISLDVRVWSRKSDPRTEDFDNFLGSFYDTLGFWRKSVRLTRKAVWNANLQDFVYYTDDRPLRQNDTFRLHIETVKKASAQFIFPDDAPPKKLFAEAVISPEANNFDTFLSKCFAAIGADGKAFRVGDVQLRQRNGTAANRRFNRRTESVLGGDYFGILLEHK